MKLQLVTPPAQYPLCLDQVKDHSRIDVDTDDAFVLGLIAAATDEVEQFLGRRIVTQTWKLFLDEWPAENYITLPFGKLASVTHVKYTDTDYTQNTFSTDYYNVDTDSEPGRVILEYGDTWPTDALSPENPIEIQFVCGYGAFSRQTITGATNATPIAITINTHGYATGDTVYIYDVGGNTEADGLYQITVSDANTFSLNGSAAVRDFTTGGTCINQHGLSPSISTALRFKVADLYEIREDRVFGTIKTELGMVENLLWPHRVWW